MENGHLLQVRVSQDFLSALDKWRGSQQPILSRAEAIRQLVDGVLKQRKKS
jgi:hypothetical protein